MLVRGVWERVRGFASSHGYVVLDRVAAEELEPETEQQEQQDRRKRCRIGS